MVSSAATVARASSLVALARTLNIPISLVAFAYFARTLPLADMGIVVGFGILVGLLQVLSDPGLSSAIITYSAEATGRGYNARALIRKMTTIGVGIAAGDVLDEWRLSWAFREFKPDFVFNLVGDTYVPTAYDVPKRMLQVNAEGNLNVLMACNHFGVERVMYVSSTEVYGNARSERIDEEHPLDPWNTYAATKVCADRICFTLHKEHGTPVIISRIFNCYGPRETEPYVIPDIISQFAKRDYVELGNIKARRDFTYVADLCEALTAVMESDIPNGDAVNVGTGTTHSVEEIARKVASIMKKPADLRTDRRRFRKYDIDLFCCDNTKLKKHTSWEPKVDLDMGLRMTIDWYMTHGKRWLWESWIEGAVVGGDGRRI